MCLRLESTGELEAIRATLRTEPAEAGSPHRRPDDAEVPAVRFEQRIDEAAPAVLTAIH